MPVLDSDPPKLPTIRRGSQQALPASISDETGGGYIAGWDFTSSTGAKVRVRAQYLPQDGACGNWGQKRVVVRHFEAEMADNREGGLTAWSPVSHWRTAAVDLAVGKSLKQSGSCAATSAPNLRVTRSVPSCRVPCRSCVVLVPPRSTALFRPTSSSPVQFLPELRPPDPGSRPPGRTSRHRHCRYPGRRPQRNTSPPSAIGRLRRLHRGDQVVRREVPSRCSKLRPSPEVLRHRPPPAAGPRPRRHDSRIRQTPSRRPRPQKGEALCDQSCRPNTCARKSPRRVSIKSLTPFSSPRISPISERPWAISALRPT